MPLSCCNVVIFVVDCCDNLDTSVDEIFIRFLLARMNSPCNSDQDCLLNQMLMLVQQSDSYLEVDVFHG